MKTKYKVKMAEGDERVFASERFHIDEGGILIFSNDFGRLTNVINKREWKEIEVMQ